MGEFPGPGGALDGVGTADGAGTVLVCGVIEDGWGGKGSDCGWIGGTIGRLVGGAAAPTAGATICGLASGVIVAVGVRLGAAGIVTSADVGGIGGGIVTNGPGSCTSTDALDASSANASGSGRVLTSLARVKYSILGRLPWRLACRCEVFCRKGVCSKLSITFETETASPASCS